jgi:hypothetical protein
MIKTIDDTLKEVRVKIAKNAKERERLAAAAAASGTAWSEWQRSNRDHQII